MGDVEEVFGAESEAEVCRRRQVASQRARELAEFAERVGEPALTATDP
jgi:hypothetical protein